MRTEAAVVTPAQPIGAQAPQEPQYRGRRFAHSFCTFQAVGIVLRAPDFVKNRRGAPPRPSPSRSAGTAT